MLRTTVLSATLPEMKALLSKALRREVTSVKLPEGETGMFEITLKDHIDKPFRVSSGQEPAEPESPETA